MKAVNNDSHQTYKLVLTDNAYGDPLTDHLLAPKGNLQIILDSRRHSGWYDRSLRVEGIEGFEKRYAGRVETGKESISDPAMG